MCAQQASKLPTIGFVGATTAATQSQWTAAFVQRLHELGWVEGRTVTIEYRWAEGRFDRLPLPEMFAEPVRRFTATVGLRWTDFRRLWPPGDNHDPDFGLMLQVRGGLPNGPDCEPYWLGEDRGDFANMPWLLRVLGLLIAATLACAAAHTARAEPGIGDRPADACGRAAFRVVIDVGHTAQAPGAISARGVPEFVFNLSLAERIEQQLLAAGFRRSVLLITEGPARKALAERVKRANALGADLFLSIHHDSVPDKFLEKWEFDGQQRSFSDRFNGHSIFISQDNSDRAGSLLFARLLGDKLRERGLQYTPHYTDRIMGNRQRLLVDAQAGVYRYDQLIVLRDTGMPAVLLEAGSIINREEELQDGLGRASSTGKRGCG